jgi:DNA-directed RNA polymerase beta subunit
MFLIIRYETPGALMHKLFRSLLRPQLSDFRTQIANMDKNNKPIDIIGAMCSERLQKGIASALQSGKFQLSKRGGRQSGTATAGVSQAITRINPMTLISHLRKTATQGTRKIPAGAR